MEKYFVLGVAELLLVAVMVPILEFFPPTQQTDFLHIILGILVMVVGGLVINDRIIKIPFNKFIIFQVLYMVIVAGIFWLILGGMASMINFL